MDAILLLKFPIKGDQLINTSQLQVQCLGLVVQYIVDAVSGNKLHLTTSTRYVEHLVQCINYSVVSNELLFEMLTIHHSYSLWEYRPIS